jgi:hypothetical protein
MVADIVFFTPMIKLADVISERSKEVYILSFEYVSEHLTGPDWQGIINKYIVLNHIVMNNSLKVIVKCNNSPF